jgi:hypothetical protein
MATIIVAQALKDLKTLDSKIKRAVNEGMFVGVQVGNKPINDHIAIDTFNKNAQSSFQSVSDLISYRDKLKAAIVQSNATTKLTVAGVEMLRCDAIEKKESIQYKKDFLTKLRQQYAHAVQRVQAENMNAQAKAEKQIETTYGKADQRKSDDAQAIMAQMKAFMDYNGAKLVDPLQIKEVIDNMTQEIEDFEADVDVALSISNATTTIEV